MSLEYIFKSFPVAIVISLIALFVAISNYRRKSGINVKGYFTITTAASAEDLFISNITLENLKDRAVIIFKIFVRVGSNYYIEIDDFEDSPKILKPYESYSSNYTPVDFYCLNMQRVSFNEILNDRKRKIQIVLSTSHGKYPVKEVVRRWDPVFDFFKNHMTACVIPMRPRNNIGYFGSKFKYLVKVHAQNGYVNTIPIYPDDFNVPRFENFRLTHDALSSRESLEVFLTEQAVNGKLKCINVEVIDADVIRAENYSHDFGNIQEARYYNKFTYHIIGRLLTIWSNCDLYFENLKIKRKISKKRNQ
ncbi:hypothetical protein ACSI5N_25500 (plasmid) [Raoultella ornithinolytica]|uniref:hypothetical protein n=1 Tax=Raoultella ornithinolytica TaxID=54291 RepID=UPI00292BB184|nr:hypothetical protein [Raoultella ornithinolytica]MDV1094982.1 hypothetical protein [Raoultella ornithinolytica]MDV1122674.1 hypothetical protein [Raoultella ornithinolytica]MDV1893189.1 hypothetical protein [Raoultella ornithinolytica]